MAAVPHPEVSSQLQTWNRGGYLAADSWPLATDWKDLSLSHRGGWRVATGSPCWANRWALTRFFRC